ncbi:DUF3164 family protein [Dysgonomonas sp. HGC4]|nr:DUF3164 family protein [Dysgonomonas sp. HGC4]MBD8348560.1 DUF3164 family protein [Dysgonomonas sp. HGC4]
MENVLSPAELAEFKEFKAQKAEKEKALKIKEDKITYKEIKDETIRVQFELLKRISGLMLEAKKTVFNNCDGLIQMKDDLFKTKSDRSSNTFTTQDGSISIKLGNRVNEGWADEVEIGVCKVQDYLRTLAKDDNSATLVEGVIRLLKPDKKGNLKASKVLELEQMAIKSNNADFMDGITLIKEAYRPSPSCMFIEVRYKDENGEEQSLPLSMSAIEKTCPNYENRKSH